jgi:hypothetical protein
MFLHTLRIVMNVVRGKILGIVIIFAGMLSTAKIMYGYLFYTTDAIVSCDPLLSESLSSIIQSHVQSAVTEHHFSLSDTLKKDFSVIKSVCVRQVRPYLVYVSVKAYEPLFLLSKGMVLLENGLLIDKTNFINEGIQHLFSLDIQEQKDSKVSTEALFWLKNISDEIFHKYQIQWLDKTRIILTDMQQSSIRVICDSTTILDTTMLAYCSKVLCEHEVLNAFKTRGQIVADLRFKDQIVIYSKRGDHEKYGFF